MYVKEKLKELDVRASKARGQNFVINDRLIENIMSFANLNEDENIIEIGPGLGALTKELYKFKNLKVIEIEEKFAEDLKKRFPNLEIINKDVRSVSLSDFGDNLTILGNLPYSFSSDIISHLIAYAPYINRAILLLQKEFAMRLAASPSTKSYGSLSVACQLWAEPRLGAVFKGGSFHPPTKVDSQIIELKFYKDTRFNVKDAFWLQRFVRACFSKRRKKIINSLKSTSIFPIDKLEQAFKDTNIDGNRRPETFSIQEFITLSEAFGKILYDIEKK
ncbi:MAG: 16S rRNA (adenine(1518)-N(6)/adenine(1519)-N(6))-dimethyltransferase RsmA [Bdellovibrionota bacterium]